MVLVALLAGCSDKNDKNATANPAAAPVALDPLDGTYNANLNGKVQPFVKVVHEDGKPTIYTIVDGHWSKLQGEVKSVSKADFESETKTPVNGNVTALETQTFVVAQVPAGWGAGKFSTKTGYFAMTPFGPLELERQ